MLYDRRVTDQRPSAKDLGARRRGLMKTLSWNLSEGYEDIYENAHSVPSECTPKLSATPHISLCIHDDSLWSVLTLSCYVSGAVPSLFGHRSFQHEVLIRTNGFRASDHAFLLRIKSCPLVECIVYDNILTRAVQIETTGQANYT
jgi:hypothetical protein